MYMHEKIKYRDNPNEYYAGLPALLILEIIEVMLSCETTHHFAPQFASRLPKFFKVWKFLTSSEMWEETRQAHKDVYSAVSCFFFNYCLP